MTATAFAMADCAPTTDGRVAAAHVRLPPERGGCGAEHEVKADDRGHAYLECDRCGPALIGSHYGWAATPGGVPLTPDEIADTELAKRDAEAGQNHLMRAMTDSFVKAMQSGQAFPGSGPAPAPPKSLVEQIAEMSPADKAALAAMLAPPVTVEVSEVDEPAAPAEPPVPPVTSRVATSGAGAKRPPGRPRKNA